MSNKKVVSGIEKIVGGFLIEGEGIDEGEVAQEIYNNRKKLGLFTKQDISKGNAYDEDGNIVEIEIN